MKSDAHLGLGDGQKRHVHLMKVIEDSIEGKATKIGGILHAEGGVDTSMCNCACGLKFGLDGWIRVRFRVGDRVYR